MGYREEYNIPGSFEELVGNGETQYSIIGVVMNDNIDAMRHFLDGVSIPQDMIKCDDGTQVTLFHPLDQSKVIVIDAGGLGDFDRHGFDVTIQDCDTEAPRTEERRDEGAFGVGA